MKKQELKQELLQTKAVIEMLSSKFIQVSTQLEEVSEALERRRILYDRLANHSTTKVPKSMNEMAEALYCTFADKTSPDILPFKELSESVQDQWMDLLLTILN